jgi:Rhamnan synthesis protein F
VRLPPAWKVRRELLRVAHRAYETLPSTSFLDRLRQTRHDRSLSRVLRETAGAQSFGERIAVFILFQPKGVAGSTYFTLDHLGRNGWSVLVVSNAPLSDGDRGRIARHSAQVIERPNIGYDFGAYREGWLWLGRQGLRPRKLILMNDSTWFPLRQSDDSLARMEALDADLAGHVYKCERFADPSQDHLESHLLMLGPRALAHPGLRHFMDSYLMSNTKAITIQRGEKGISQAALAAGLTVKGLMCRDKMLELLSSLSDEALLEALRSLALHSDESRSKRDAWLAAAAAGRPWRKDFLAWTHRELSSTRQHLVGATFIDPAMNLGGLGYLKKQTEVRFQLARMAVVRGIGAGRIAPMEPLVAEEVATAIRSWKPPTDWRSNPHEAPKELAL